MGEVLLITYLMKKVPLTGGNYALVDDEDYRNVSGFRWKEPGGYAAHNSRKGGRPFTVYMHRLITAAPGGMKVDHRNHDGLDNRKANLRVCTHSQNHMNRVKLVGRSSRYKGVSWHAGRGQWRAYLTLDGTQRHIGYFDNETHAALGYDMWAHTLFGQYALTNFTAAGTGGITVGESLVKPQCP